MGQTRFSGKSCGAIACSMQEPRRIWEGVAVVIVELAQALFLVGQDRVHVDVDSEFGANRTRNMSERVPSEPWRPAPEQVAFQILIDDLLHAADGLFPSLGQVVKAVFELDFESSRIRLGSRGWGRILSRTKSQLKCEAVGPECIHFEMGWAQKWAQWPILRRFRPA